MIILETSHFLNLDLFLGITEELFIIGKFLDIFIIFARLMNNENMYEYEHCETDL